MTNRLADSLSPYLRQHADNPVDWLEWGPEAFAQARERGVPVLVSIGYAACHWCHVMAHESFEDGEVAERLRAGFVAVKVDREERPDVDAAYMQATTALTGSGGWPMTVLATPDGDPFFAGTYLPREGFLRLLDAASTAWQEDRERVTSSARSIADQLAQAARPSSFPALTPGDLDDAVPLLARGYDERAGGFGGAPKFPPSMCLAWLLERSASDDDEAGRLSTGTLDAMARGGLHDQLEGGFARYSVDADWVVPHFEKMLYDNALLLRVYAVAAATTGSAFFVSTALMCADFLQTRLLTDEGAYASSLDADTTVPDGRGGTHGVEGATYVWTPAQLVEVLGPDDGARAARLLSVTEGGTFEHGTSTLQLREDPDDPAWWADVRDRLRAARAQRPQPARDDKVVTAWNGLAIAGLADAGRLLERPELVEAARTAAVTVLDLHLVDGRLRRTSLGGVVSEAPGLLEDHGNLAEGLLTLATADPQDAPRWRAAAARIVDLAVEGFRDGDGTWFDTPHDGERLFLRPRADTDNAEPCGISAIAGALAGLGRSDEARAALDQMAGTVRRAPRFAGWALTVAQRMTGDGAAACVGAHEDAAPPLLASPLTGLDLEPGPSCGPDGCD